MMVSSAIQRRDGGFGKRSPWRLGLRALWVSSSALTFALVGAAQPSPDVAPDEVEPADEQFQAVDAEGLTPDQLRSTVENYLERMRTLQAAMRELFATAQEDSDVVKTLCLEDKLTQMGIAVETATDRAERMQAALDAGALERAHHEFSLIGALAERAHDLAEEGNQCIGEETSFSEDDDSTLALDLAGELPDVDADQIAVPPVLAVPPSVKSPVD